jgi:hypothetical protein
MFDFPTAPIVGAEYTSAGVTYVFTGLTWDIKGGDLSDYVLKAGDAMTGPLTVGSANAGWSYVRLATGNATQGGLVEWYNQDATRKAYIGWGDPTNINFELESAVNLNINNGDVRMGNGNIWLNNANSSIRFTDAYTINASDAAGGIMYRANGGWNYHDFWAGTTKRFSVHGSGCTVWGTYTDSLAADLPESVAEGGGTDIVAALAALTVKIKQLEAQVAALAGAP